MSVHFDRTSGLKSCSLPRDNTRAKPSINVASPDGINIQFERLRPYLETLSAIDALAACLDSSHSTTKLSTPEPCRCIDLDCPFSSSSMPIDLLMQFKRVRLKRNMNECKHRSFHSTTRETFQCQQRKINVGDRCAASKRERDERRACALQMFCPRPMDSFLILGKISQCSNQVRIAYPSSKRERNESDMHCDQRPKWPSVNSDWVSENRFLPCLNFDRRDRVLLLSALHKKQMCSNGCPIIHYRPLAV